MEPVPVNRVLPFFALIFLLAHSSIAISANEWYEGGTLQQATVGEWCKATPDNQLATAADFIAFLHSLKEMANVKNPDELRRLRQKAMDLRLCVNQQIEELKIPAEKAIADIVMYCVTPPLE